MEWASVLGRGSDDWALKIVIHPQCRKTSVFEGYLPARHIKVELLKLQKVFRLVKGEWMRLRLQQDGEVTPSEVDLLCAGSLVD